MQNSLKTIIIVEDEFALRENYTAMLENQGYKVIGYASRHEAEAAFQSGLPDLVILDISLEDDLEGGFDLCRQLRALSIELPIIFLTARNNDIDTISGLRLGADDYLTKDISLLHLSARISALFRRTDALKTNHPANIHNTPEAVSDLTIDLERLSVSWQMQPVDLTITELWILHALVKHPGHVKSREQLMQAANTLVDDNTVTAQIKRIRNKFLQQDAEFNCIESIYGAGYRWQCKVI
ncbi:MAG: proteobacterial dedicated sortase system response regulator [gamma proteobacterium symbiont of Taylorina sp.]|nr:proteobacterial dedicated sortase system response regulator [gamma proteobacterium symbiont of Taylorina sp.]